MAPPRITENGYSFPEAASSLKKTIRRGLEQEAMFWATELETKFHDYPCSILRLKKAISGRRGAGSCWKHYINKKPPTE